MKTINICEFKNLGKFTKLSFYSFLLTIALGVLLPYPIRAFVTPIVAVASFVFFFIAAKRGEKL